MKQHHKQIVMDEVAPGMVLAEDLLDAHGNGQADADAATRRQRRARLFRQCGDEGVNGLLLQHITCYRLDVAS